MSQSQKSAVDNHSSASAPNIVWLTVDSVRYDHTSMSEYGRDTTPNLAQLAAEADGLLFPYCFSHGIWTQPSSASILSGTYPSVHGVGIQEGNDVLPESLSTVPELLSEVGYYTACLSEMGNVGPATGLDRGFDEYRPPHVERSKLDLAINNPRATLRQLFKNALPALTNPAEVVERGFSRLTDGGTPLFTVEMLKRWLPSLHRRSDPFFLYVHMNGPHVPNAPPHPYQHQYRSEDGPTVREALTKSEELLGNPEEMRRLCTEKDPLDSRLVDALVDLYDCELRYIDTLLADLFDIVTDLDNTVLIVTADHGDLFGEAGVFGHRLITHDSLTHIPLVVHGLEDIAHQRSEFVQHMDVMETLVDTAGGDTNQFQGINLKTETREYAITQKGGQNSEVYLKHDPSFDTSRFHNTLTTSFRSEKFKYNRSEEMTELFELPNETVDVSDEYPDVVAAFEEDVVRFLDRYGKMRRTSTSGHVSAAVKQQLADLGYGERVN